MAYSDNGDLEHLIVSAVAAVTSGETAGTGLNVMIKKSPTGILAASPDHAESRYQPGNSLVTYNGIDAEGKPIQETWGGGVAQLSSNSVILKNEKPLTYPEGHKLAGEAVLGFYQADGTFVVDQENGTTQLFNEYVSDREFVKSAYGVEAKGEWQVGFKMQPSYVMQIPEGMGAVDIITPNATISLHGGDYVIMDTKKGKVTSVHGCERSFLEATYVGLDDYLAEKGPGQ